MKKYKIFPKEALITFSIIVLIGSIMLVIIDKNMPQYGSWKKENTFINEDKKIKMESIRNLEYPLIKLKSSDISKSGNKKKIMIIGDSYIEGDGYNNLNQTWYRQLELELHDRGYYDVEILGVGISGASTYDEMKWLTTTTLIKDNKPDLIIFGYVINDPELDDENGETIIKHTTTKRLFNSNKLLKGFNNLFPNIAYKIDNMFNVKADKTQEYSDETGYPDEMWYSVIVNEKWSEVYKQKAVNPLCDYLNSIDIPSFIITTPNGVNPKYEEWYHVLSFFENKGIKVYNMFNDFRNMVSLMTDKANGKINPVNGHPGTAYTKYYANYIADILENDYKNRLGNQYTEKVKYPIYINDWVPYKLDTTLIKNTEDEVKYQITYPENSNMLYMPLKKRYLKLSLEYPVSIKEINLKSKNLKNAEIYVGKIDKNLGYDNQSLYHISSKQKGNNIKFQINSNELITSINISADTIKNEKIEITIKR